MPKHNETRTVLAPALTLVVLENLDTSFLSLFRHIWASFDGFLEVQELFV